MRNPTHTDVKQSATKWAGVDACLWSTSPIRWELFFFVTTISMQPRTSPSAVLGACEGCETQQQGRQALPHVKSQRAKPEEGRIQGLPRPSYPRVAQRSRSPVSSYNSLHSFSALPFPFPWTASRHDSGLHQLLTSLVILFTAWPHPSGCSDFPDRNLAALIDYDSDFRPSHIAPALLCTQPLWLDWYPDIILLCPSLKPLSWVRQGSGTLSTPESGGRVRKPWNEIWGEITGGFGAEGG